MRSKVWSWACWAMCLGVVRDAWDRGSISWKWAVAGVILLVASFALWPREPKREREDPEARAAELRRVHAVLTARLRDLGP